MTNIKPSNYWAMHDDFLLNCSRIQGSKLIALNKLIQTKGHVLETENEKLKGIKTIEIKEGFYIGLKVTHVKKDSFFPCKVQKFSFQKL